MNMLRSILRKAPELSRQRPPWTPALRLYSSASNALYLDYGAPDECASRKTRIASVALVGAPNAGKSSLSNAMIETRVSAVSRKMNTTRDRTIGAYTEGERQLIFWDTPGVVERQFVKELGEERRLLTSSGWGAAADADIALLVVDTARGEQYWNKCARISEQLAGIRQSAEQENGLVLVLNKCDKVKPRSHILLAADFFRNDVKHFDTVFGNRVFMVSAWNGRGVNDLRDSLLEMTKEGEFEVTPQTRHCGDDLHLVRQHVWEKLLHRVHQELPYRCYFENDRLLELPNGDLYISEIVRVPRSSAVPILIGPKGSVIEWIREKAMLSASEALGRQVHLKLRVALA